MALEGMLPGKNLIFLARPSHKDSDCCLSSNSIRNGILMKSIFSKINLLAALVVLTGIAATASAQTATPVAPSKPNAEMPPALKNMQPGDAAYQKEHQKWVNSQNQSPEAQKREAQKNVAALQAAQLKTAKTPAQNPATVEKAPYLNYKGITDPAKAKEAWYKDQKATGQ